MESEKRTILITGAAGFIGMELCLHALKSGFEVIALDAFRGGLYSSEVKRLRADKLKHFPGIEFYDIDLTSDTLQLPGEFSFVIHSAGMPGLTYSFANPVRYIADNEVATLNLVKAIEGVGVQKFVFVSTSSVYGRRAVGNEDSELQPISPYGLTKLAAERIVDFYLPQKTDYSIARLFSVYGPGQRPDMGFYKFIDSVMNDKPIKIFGDGTQSRSNTYITDAVEGIFGVLMNGKDGQKYNIGGIEEIRLLEAIETIYEIAQKKPNLDFDKPRPGDQKETRAVIARAEAHFGYNPSTPFREGIRAQYNWQKRLESLPKYAIPNSLPNYPRD